MVEDERREERPEGGEEPTAEGTGQEATPEEASQESASEEAGQESAPEEAGQEAAPEEASQESADGAPAGPEAGPVSEGPEASAAPDQPEGTSPPEQAETQRRDDAAEPPSTDDAAEPKRPARGRERRGRPGSAEAGEQPEVVPGADLEPDLVLDEPGDEGELDEAAAARYAEAGAEATAEEALPTAPEEAPPAAAEPAPLTPRELAADARYQATGKRKTAVARVVLKPGSGEFTVNGRALDQFFPRHGLRATARQPLAAAGYESRMDVVARLHGGGVSSQAGALRHGVARALVDADPALREELKRRGYLTRDPRAKERKKAGLKKARKRPQFSKR